MNEHTRAAVKRILRPFSFSISAAPHGRRFSVPILQGVGSSHRHGTEAWMVELLQSLFKLAGRAGLIDVGVNIGQTLVKLRSFDDDCPYFGFEPSPFCVLYVNQLIDRNRLRNCTILPIALAETPGLVALETVREGDSEASIVEGLRGEQESRREYVAALPFDGLALDVDGVPVVKIDVEGAELDVIAGMLGFLRSARPFVICEVLHAHSAQQLPMITARNAKLMSKLEEVDYGVLRVRKDGSRLGGVEPVSAFPEETYRWDSQQFCDYVFMPRELADAVTRALNA